MGARDLQAEYLLLCCCIRDSLEFDMQHKHVLKKLNFDYLSPPPKSTQRVGHGPSIEYHV